MLQAVLVHNVKDISIHALCEEGDPLYVSCNSYDSVFLSTPSARRATMALLQLTSGGKISIHALCEEGDQLI